MKFFQAYSALAFSIWATLSSNIIKSVDINELNTTNQAVADNGLNLVIDSELNKTLNKSLQQLNYFAHTLEYLALLLYSEGNKFAQKEEISSYIKSTLGIINGIKESSFIVPEPSTIITIQTINNELCKNLQTAINSNQWQAIDLGLIIKRSGQTNLSIMEIKQLQEQTQNELKKLETTVERFGLSFSQKMIRNIEDYYNSTKFYIEQHKLEPYLKYAAIGAAVTTYLIYQSEYVAEKTPPKLHFSFWNNCFFRGIKKLTGSAPEYDASILQQDDVVKKNFIKSRSKRWVHPKYDCPINNEDQLGLLGKLEQEFSNKIGSEFTPSVLISGFTLGWLSHKIIDDSKLASFGLFLILDPTVRMAAAVNMLLQIQNADRYKDFKYYTKKYLIKKYNALRGKSNKSSLAQKPNMTFNDVIGMDYAKKEFEAVVDYIINPDKFERTKLTPAKGYLMVGPPRTGKSFIAKAICGEINERQKLLGKPKTTNFIPLDADLVSDKSFYKIMEYINSKAPCVVFIDEIDLLCLNRGDGNKENKLLSQILTHMSGYVSSPEQEDFNNNSGKQVIFVAATNNPHNLDSALLQPGRFGKIISFDYPHLTERIKFISSELEKRSIFTIKESFIAEIAKELEGYSFEDLFLVIIGAIQKASSQYLPVNESHFRAAIEESLKSIMPQSKILSDQEIATIAIYQSGKALATKLLTPDVNISTLTTMPINKKIESQKDSKIITTPTIQHGGIFTYKNCNLLGLKDEYALMLECQILLAGHIAQELMLGSSCYTYRPEDQQMASSIAKQIALQGENYSDMTEDLQQAILKKTYIIKNECKQKIKAILNDQIATLNKIARALQKHRYLSEKEIDELIQK